MAVHWRWAKSINGGGRVGGGLAKPTWRRGRRLLDNAGDDDGGEADENTNQRARLIPLFRGRRSPAAAAARRGQILIRSHAKTRPDGRPAIRSVCVTRQL
jgi:hypothetical protein